ncbi:MAG TPA: hypothetical protein VGB63_15510 [Pedobacter sp.]|jgi:hypothetical protein
MIKSLKYLVFLISSIYGCNFINLKPTKAQLSYISSAEVAEYPSGSTISFRNGHFYLMGDDARSLVVLDSSLSIIETINLFPGTEPRIQKIDKADIESSEWIGEKLYLFGSGSVTTTRDSGFVFDPEDRQVFRIDLGGFYRKMIDIGIPALNLEGAAVVKDHLIFANRSNLSNNENYLLLNPVDHLLENITKAISLKLPGDAGVSGLTYLPKEDVLILTASEEDTGSTYDDGAIGGSYLGLIREASTKLSMDEVVPDQWMPLVAVHKDFFGQKIESVCMYNNDKDKTELLLVSDNDNGTTRVFRVALH